MTNIFTDLTIDGCTLRDEGWIDTSDWPRILSENDQKKFALADALIEKSLQEKPNE